MIFSGKCTSGRFWADSVPVGDFGWKVYKWVILGGKCTSGIFWVDSVPVEDFRTPAKLNYSRY